MPCVRCAVSLLTFSLREYEACLTSLRQVFHTQPDDAQAALRRSSCAAVGAGKAGNGRSCAGLWNYLESLAARSGGLRSSRTTARTGTALLANKQVEQFPPRDHEDLFEVYYQPVYSLHQQSALSPLRRSSACGIPRSAGFHRIFYPPW